MNGQHAIIAGERRWRASKLADLSSIPAIIRDITEESSLEIALIENIQRENLTVTEEADGYRKLIKQHNYTQEQLGKILGKSRSHIANLIRLLELPNEVKEMLEEQPKDRIHKSPKSNRQRK